MNKDQLNETVKALTLIAKDLKTESQYASEVVESATETLQEMALVIDLLKAKVGLLEFQLQVKDE